jgi:chromosomal replication initiation ATPase DnaA
VADGVFIMKRELNFKNFYIHAGNEVAYLAAQKVIESLGEIFNPFYVYGDTGMGKTHLLRAIHFGSAQKCTVLFFTAKEFEKYVDEGKKIDTPVIVDDIHILSSKYQKVIAEVIDTSLANNRQTCFSGNRAPRDMENIDATLLSRLEGGLVCDIQPPKQDVLADMIRKKSEELGINLLDDVVTELAHACNGSVRAAEGMINRLKVHASRGVVSFDTLTVRSVLKEFYPKGLYTPVSSLVQEFKKDATEILQDVSKKLNIRDLYKEKIQLWEVKGYDMSSLKTVLNGDITVLKRRYDDFIKSVKRLTALQEELRSLDTSHFPDEMLKIESMLFSPRHVDEVEKLVTHIKRGIVEEEPEPAEEKHEEAVEEKQIKTKESGETEELSEAFKTFIIGDNNKSAYTIYKKQILKNLGKKLNPFIIFGKKGTGKTYFLNAINKDLVIQKASVGFFDLATDNELRKACEVQRADVLILDNFTHIFSASKDQRNKIFKLILSYIKKDKAVFIGSEVIPADEILSEEEKIIFEIGLEVQFTAPDSVVAGQYIMSKLGSEEATKIIRRGLPKFESFYEIDDFLASFKPPAPMSVVPLGFPGEDSEDTHNGMTAEVPADEESKIQISESVSLQQRKLMVTRDDRYMFTDITDELIEENY